MVYPRVCGGTIDWLPIAGLRRGLSPRVRGNPIALPHFGILGRSIPACAGEPKSTGGMYIAFRVYPRVCGGTRGAMYGRVSRCGLSPRVRGNPGHRPMLHGKTRSIPACAGEPGIGRSATCATTVYPRVCGGTLDLACRLRCWLGLSPRVRGNRIPGTAYGLF